MRIKWKSKFRNELNMWLERMQTTRSEKSKKFSKPLFQFIEITCECLHFAYFVSILYACLLLLSTRHQFIYMREAPTIRELTMHVEMDLKCVNVENMYIKTHFVGRF